MGRNGIKYWEYRTTGQNKLFGIWCRNHTSAFNEHRIGKALIGPMEYDVFNDWEHSPIANGVCGEYHPYFKRFSPPIELAPRTILTLLVGGQDNDWVQAGYETAEPLDFIKTADLPEARGGRTLSDAVTTGAVATYSPVISLVNYDELIIGIECGTADVDITIDASLDGTNFNIPLQALATITSGADPTTYRITEYYPYVRVSHVDSSAGAPWGVVTEYLAVKQI